MLKNIFTKKNIVFFIISSIITLLMQIVAFLNIDVVAGSLTFWIVILTTNIFGWIIGYVIKKIDNPFSKEK